ncbi:rhodanese-like domain-containing protein [Mangrovimonas spongiae]|uniref:Rhodanese-like domain-containing protein n=1 Tax=Mangrovimonas spongiae TaxID=2494697 RepID=A0A3R9MCX2_9FLAO|nr:rhodanese-like domain-containing protein [Mangrovimonas spongiae]RSK39083.1 rhodanese-like domain-containing protein [Mangrovimonas spongiae]
MGFLSFLFGNRDKKIKTYLDNGAVILDVRTLQEYNNGHIDGSKHIPLNELNNRVDELKTLNKPLIVCCASGVRSTKAAKFLNLNNLDAINGGGWKSLESKL